jgi:hypothetical protein
MGREVVIQTNLKAVLKGDAMNSEIIIGPYTYKIDHESNTIKRYDEEYKMWMTVRFGCGNNPDAAADVIRMLTDEYLKSLS